MTADLSVQPPEPTRTRSLARRVIGDTLARWGARTGLLWIGSIVVVGVLSPFIASSHPILFKKDGHVTSPMLVHLTAIDVLLLCLLVCSIALSLIRGVGVWKSLLVFVLVAGTAGPLALKFVKPPSLAVLSQYREAEASGEAQWAVRTIVPYSPADRFADLPQSIQNQPPSRKHWMGTTPTGEDVLSRMVHASRIAVSIGFVSTGISLLIGVTIGAIMGYFSGRVDIIGMRLIEIFESIPTLFLLIMLVAFYGRDLYLMMVIIGITTWTGISRFVRAEFLRLRKMDFVQAAIALGLPLRSVLFRHMLPNGLTPVLINASFSVAAAILAESTLSFLDLGLIDAPSWGKLLDQARGVGTDFYWWLAVFPGGAIFLTVFAYNMIGEALRDALDPRLLKREA